MEEPACSRISPPSTTNEASMSDYNFRAETTISEEVNRANGGGCGVLELHEFGERE